MANKETTVKIKYEPDLSSLTSAADQASKVLEQSISKVKPNVNVDVSTKSVDKASEAVDKLYDRFRNLPNTTKVLENQMGKSFDNIAKLQDKALSGSLNNKNFEKMVNQNLNYVDKMLKNAEKKFSGTDFFGENSRQKMERYLKSGIIKGPKVEMNEIDTTGLESNIQSIFGNLGTLAGLAFAVKFTKKMLSDIAKAGGDIQDLQFGLQGFFGIENGVAAMQEFRKLAKELPGDMNDAVEGFISLKNRGIEPTRQEFKDLVTFANSQGKNIDNLSMALSMAQTENYMRLRAYGVTIEKNGSKLIASFRGQRTELDRTGDAVVKYIAGLGQIPDVISTSDAKMNSLRGTQEKINESLDNMKFYVYQQWEKILAPLSRKVLDVVESIENWVRLNPELATDLVELVTAIGATTAAVTGLMLVIKTIGLLASPITLGIVAISLALWDLWNGITEGESVILGFLETVGLWHDSNETILEDLEIINGEIVNVGITAQETMEGQVLPSWISSWDSMGMSAHNTLMQILTMSGITSDSIAGTFIQNIPKGGGGFAGLARAAGATFDKIAMAAINLINFLIDKFNALNQKMADIFSGIPFLEDIFNWNAKVTDHVTNTFKSGLEGVANSVGGSILNRDYEDQQSRKMAGYNSERILNDLNPTSVNSIINKSDPTSYKPIDINNPTMQKEMKRAYGTEVIPGTNTPTSAQRKSDRWSYAVADMQANGSLPNFSPFQALPGGMTGNSPSGGGKGRNGGNKGNKNSGSSQDKNAFDRATIIAVEGIKDVLKKMGYSLEKEIKRADLFMAQREAMKDMMIKKDKSGIIDTYNTIRGNQQTENNVDNSNRNQQIIINFNGNSVGGGSKLNVKGSTKLEDLLNMNKWVTGG